MGDPQGIARVVRHSEQTGAQQAVGQSGGARWLKGGRVGSWAAAGWVRKCPRLSPPSVGKTEHHDVALLHYVLFAWCPGWGWGSK